MIGDAESIGKLKMTAQLIDFARSLFISFVLVEQH